MEHICLCKVKRKGKSFTICNSFYECIHKSNEFYLTKEIYIHTKVEFMPIYSINLMLCSNVVILLLP